MDGNFIGKSEMKAVYLKGFSGEVNDEVYVEGDEARHLMVTRTKAGENFLILNGKGSSYLVEVRELVSKSKILGKIRKAESKEPMTQITLGLGLPKKEAFERSCQICQEFAVSELIPLETEFTQFNKINAERIEKIIVGSLKQSNSFFLTKIAGLTKWKNLEFNKYDRVVYFDPYAAGGNKLSLGKNCGKLLILIGPEGGFSKSELEDLENVQNLSRVSICDTILKTETCVAGSLGFIMNELKSETCNE